MSMPHPRVRQPAEWEPHAAVWTAWPSHASYWEGGLEPARKDVAGMVNALVVKGTGQQDPEKVHVWVDGDEAYQSAQVALNGLEVTLTRESLGDIWFRDIGPVFVQDQSGQLQARGFGYNGWGEKYRMEHDETIAERLAAHANIPFSRVPMVFEGGALEVNGEGLALTTKSCLLNRNRNPGMEKSIIEKQLLLHLGVESLVWLREGLLNDHTDGHIDNLARFIGKKMVVCQYPAGKDDPNREVLLEIGSMLRSYRTPSGDALEVIEIPSPGRVENSAGSIVPASHLNFYIANHRVLVPCYGSPSENSALEALAALFPGREVVGLPARGLLDGGGAFHCITQQQPADTV